MNVFEYNASWMLWNISLALIGIVLSWCIMVAKKPATKTGLFLLWLAFVPNTIYILTDTEHIFHQWRHVVGAAAKTLLLSQYALFLPLGVVTFYISMRLFEKGFKKAFVHYKNKLPPLSYLRFSHFIVLLNFLIAFGVVLGRTQRTNSWELITDSHGALQDVLRVFDSSHLLTATFLFGLSANILYFSLKKLLLSEHFRE